MFQINLLLILQFLYMDHLINERSKRSKRSDEELKETNTRGRAGGWDEDMREQRDEDMRERRDEK